MVRTVSVWTVASMVFAVLYGGLVAGVMATALYDATPCEEEGPALVFLVDDNLVNDEIGYDPSLPTNYNIDRTEEVSVPDAVSPDEPLSLPGVELTDEPSR